MGPLHGLKVIELAALGPAPFAAMVLADLGADVVRVDRIRAGVFDMPGDLLLRGRRSVRIDLKRGAEVVARLSERADVLIEGFRPGVMERLSLGPEALMSRNPGLIYGRMTGYGQTGPLAQAAGHDIDYIALSGALEPLGRAGDKPLPPLNLLGDYGGGGMLLVAGVLAALYERSVSGRGQVIDAAMIDGSALLSTMVHSLRRLGMWSGARGENLLDTGAPFYEVYETADHAFVAVGALEPEFYQQLVSVLGLRDDARFAVQMDRSAWPAMRSALTELFATRTRAEWEAAFENADACFAPVLSPWEAPDHPHHRARQTFVELDGTKQPAPAPRFSRSTTDVPTAPPRPGAHTDEVLIAWGFEQDELHALRSSGAIS